MNTELPAAIVCVSIFLGPVIGCALLLGAYELGRRIAAYFEGAE